MPYLIYAPNTTGEKIHQLRIGKNTIGRSLENTIVEMDESLSRFHAEILIANSHRMIKDLKSLNHTFVNEVQIDQQELKNGDSVRCGNVRFKFVEILANSSLPSPPQTSQPSIPETIVRQFSPEQTRFAMSDLLDSDKKTSSVLKIRQQDTNQRAVDKFKILLEVSKELSSPEEPQRLLNKILNLLFEIMNVDRAAILMSSEGKLKLQAVKLRLGIPKEENFYSKQIINFVCEHGDAILTSDARRDQRFNQSESILVQKIHASMCVPLKPREEVLGVLYVDNLSRSDVYTDEDIEFLTALANQAAIAIENSKLHTKMQEEAVMRSKLERFFPRAMSKKIREEDKLGIVDTEVTALFSDISGFTKMSSTMEPRKVIEMLNEYFQVMVEEIVFRYEGTLEKYIGDALFAVWGAPYQQANDAERAVQSAIEMQLAIKRLNQKWTEQGKQPIDIHIGINTGKVAAGNIGSEKLIQYATIGNTTNITSRICNVAQAGEIVISQSTCDRLQALNLPLEKMPLVTVRGKDQPLQLYRLLWKQWQTKTTLPSLDAID